MDYSESSCLTSRSHHKLIRVQVWGSGCLGVFKGNIAIAQFSSSEKAAAGTQHLPLTEQTRFLVYVPKVKKYAYSDKNNCILANYLFQQNIKEFSLLLSAFLRGDSTQEKSVKGLVPDLFSAAAQMNKDSWIQ